MKPFRVRLIQDHDGIYEGSVIYVNRMTKLYYHGEWPSMFGTYMVRVPKKVCRRVRG